MTGNRMQGFSGMPMKQKVMAGLTIIILIIVVWMIIGMFKDEKGSTTITPVQSKPMSAPTSQGTTAMPQGTAMVTGQSGVTPISAPPSPQIAQTNVMTINKNTDLIKAQQQTQKDYIDKINELQLLKVQREISETNQAISAARLATVTADKSMTDLLTKPAAPDVPTGAYATGLANPIPSGAIVPVGPKSGPTTPPMVTAAPTITYVVISVSMQLGTWHAVIGQGGKLYNVGIGDVLPPDGSVVTSITSRGIVIEKDNKRQIINIVSQI